MSYEKQLVKFASEVIEEVVKSWLRENRNEIITAMAGVFQKSAPEPGAKPPAAKAGEAIYLTPSQLATRWDFHVESIRRLLRRRVLPTVRIGRRILVLVDAVKEYEQNGFLSVL